MAKNIVLIMADQQRKDYLGCYGNPYVRTPNLDSIAKRSVQFDCCYVNNPICMPNRMSIFTGRYPRNHGMWTNGLILPGELPTLANTLHDNGYDTCNIGKIHFQPTDCGPSFPVGESMEDGRYWKQIDDNIDWYGPYWGYDHVELTVNHATKPLAHYGKWFHENGGTDEMANPVKVEGFEYCPVTTMPERLHDSMFVGERSAEYIRSHAGQEKPFFLVARFPDPHHPFNPPLETALRYKDVPVRMPVHEDDELEGHPRHYHYHQMGVWHRAGLLKALPDMPEEDRQKVGQCKDIIGKFMDEGVLRGLGLLSHGDSSGEDKQPSRIDSADRDQRIRNTYAMVDLIDQGVGKILDALRETGTLEDTIIVVTSDHGELMGDHGLWLKGPFFYDGLINVPLMVCAPGIEPGKTRALASSVDIYPTICELAGVKTPGICDGVSQVNSLKGGSARNHCMIEYRNGYFENDVNTMGYIDDDYKFIQYQNGECELTSRKNDPNEDVNLAADPAYAELVTKYREKLLMAILNTGNRYPEQVCHA